MRNVLLLSIASTVLLGCTAADTLPDFGGVWARHPNPYANGENPPLPGGEPALKEPYASAYKESLAKKRAADEHGTPLIDDSTRCLPEGMPTIMGATYPLEIFQSPRDVVVLAELFTQTRRIFLNETLPPLDEVTPSYNGSSIGHYEGQTLVVETRGVLEDVKFAPFGIPHSRNMKITEQLRLAGPDLLENHITIEDPGVLDSPYVFTFRYKRKPDYKVSEYICDNNRYEPDETGNGVKLNVNPK
ncbi:MAG: hypothetical protein ABI859_00230 [Pseudomonadota bacterium]